MIEYLFYCAFIIPIEFHIACRSYGIFFSFFFSSILSQSHATHNTDVPDIVCQEYAVPHMQDLIPKIPGGYCSVRLTPPPLNNIFPKPPPIPPPPSEKYYAATAICKPATPTTPSTAMNAYSDVDGISTDDDYQLQEFPRQSLGIVEKLGTGIFGDFHLCETKGIK